MAIADKVIISHVNMNDAQTAGVTYFTANLPQKDFYGHRELTLSLCRRCHQAIWRDDLKDSGKVETEFLNGVETLSNVHYCE